MLTITINESAGYAHATQGRARQTLTVAQAENALKKYKAEGRTVSISTNDSRERIAVIGGAK